MTPAQTTELVTLDDYSRAGGFNVLAPSVEITGEVRSDVLVESISVVTINPSVESGEIYHDFRYANQKDGKAALTSLGLAKISNAAGIKWIPDLCGIEARERRSDGHVYVRYRAGAGIRQPNGEWHVEVATKAIDTEDEAEKLADADRRTFERTHGRKSAPSWVGALGKDAADDGTLERAIEQRVRQQILQLREHLESHAETKAKSRCIRRILALKQTYTRQELQRPFAVPRLLYRPDLADPLAIEQVQIEGRRAAEALYGASTSTPHATGEAPSQALPSPDPTSAPPAAGRDHRELEAPVAEHGTSPAARPTKTSSAKAAGETPAAAGAEEAAPPVGANEEGAPAGGPPRPSEDPELKSGPHKGQPISEVALQDPDYLRSLMTDGRVSAEKKELARAWLEWTVPGSTEAS